MFYTTGSMLNSPYIIYNTGAEEGRNEELVTSSPPEWIFSHAGRQHGPISTEQLFKFVSSGIIPEGGFVFNILQNRQLPYSVVLSINSRFSPSIFDFMKSRRSRATTVFCGPNNSGKSNALKAIYLSLGNDAFLLQCNRFYHVDQLGTFNIQHDFRPRDQFTHAYYSQDLNSENNNLDLQSLLTSLSDENRTKLFELCSLFIGQEFEIRLVDESNKLFSPKYVSVGGVPLKLASTGTRLLMTMLCTLLDTRFNTVLIDEPEIGLSPRIQSQLANLIFDTVRRAHYFPHIKKIFMATHSHLFINNTSVGDNFIVSRSSDDFAITEIKSRQQMNRLKLNLLGNTLESLFLPSAIVITEGICDQKFLNAVFEKCLPDYDIAVINAQGDGHFARSAKLITGAFGPYLYSPYRERLFAVLDSTHSANHKDIARAGVKKDNIFVWPNNGIEYHYPKDIIGKIFGLGDQVSNDQILPDSSSVTIGEHTIKKTDLVERVCSKLGTNVVLDHDVQRLVELLRQALS